MATHSCYICDGYRDPITERWIKGKPRSLLSAMNDHSRFRESGGDPSQQKYYHNQINDPIQLTANLRRPFYEYILPDPMHHTKVNHYNINSGWGWWQTGQWCQLKPLLVFKTGTRTWHYWSQTCKYLILFSLVLCKISSKTSRRDLTSLKLSTTS